MPSSQDPKSYTYNPLLAERKYAPWEKWEIIRNEAILFFFLLPCIDNLHLYQNEERVRDISLSERHAAEVADAVQAILLQAAR